MSATPTSSTRITVAGAILCLAALGVSLFLLPDASRKQREQTLAADNARKKLAEERYQLDQMKRLDAKLTTSQTCMERLLDAMPKDGGGKIQWLLSCRLDELKTKHGVKIQAVKYTPPSREGGKGTDLEFLDVQFTALGVYQAIKALMLDLESTDRPIFSVTSAKWDETPEGSRLSISLRAFRRTGTFKLEGATEAS